MALNPNFPKSPHDIIDPAVRWLPADETLRDTDYGKLLPPLVHKIREEVKAWRDNGYSGAAETSKALLNWWFNTPHPVEAADGTMSEFQYYFAQREALETIIYLYDVFEVRDKYDLMRFDSSGAVSTGMFDEDWRRFVLKIMNPIPNYPATFWSLPPISLCLIVSITIFRGCAFSLKILCCPITVAPLLSEDMATYQELEKDIFGDSE